MYFFSIRTRLIVALTVILLSGFLVTNVISYRASKQQIHSSIVETSLPLARDNIYSEIQRDLMRPIFVPSLMANDTFLKDWVTAGNQPAFFEYDAHGSHILLTSRFVEELDWYLLVEQDETPALKSIQTTFVQNFFIGLGITLITILFAILVINYFQHHLELMATTDKMTKAYNRRHAGQPDGTGRQGHVPGQA